MATLFDLPVTLQEFPDRPGKWKLVWQFRILAYFEDKPSDDVVDQFVSLQSTVADIWNRQMIDTPIDWDVISSEDFAKLAWPLFVPVLQNFVMIVGKGDEANHVKHLGGKSLAFVPFSPQ